MECLAVSCGEYLETDALESMPQAVGLGKYRIQMANPNGHLLGRPLSYHAYEWMIVCMPGVVRSLWKSAKNDASRHTTQDYSLLRFVQETYVTPLRRYCSDIAIVLLVCGPRAGDPTFEQETAVAYRVIWQLSGTLPRDIIKLVLRHYFTVPRCEAAENAECQYGDAELAKLGADLVFRFNPHLCGEEFWMYVFEEMDSWEKSEKRNGRSGNVKKGLGEKNCSIQ